MCASCIRKATAEEVALEIYREGVDINGDVTLELEYAVLAPTRPAQPAQPVARPVAAPEPRYADEKKCETCPRIIRLADMTFFDWAFELDLRRFERETRCDHCLWVWVQICRDGKPEGLNTFDDVTAEHITAWEAAHKR